MQVRTHINPADQPQTDKTERLAQTLELLRDHYAEWITEMQLLHRQLSIDLAEVRRLQYTRERSKP